MYTGRSDPEEPMTLREEFREDKARTKDTIIGDVILRPGEDLPPSKQDALSSGYVALLLDWVERLAAEVDQLRGTGPGAGNGKN